MRPWKMIATIATVVCIFAALAAVPATSVAKTCGSGYVHAVIGGAQKCLTRGEFCSFRFRNQYHRYGFNCVLSSPSETYHLEPRR